MIDTVPEAAIVADDSIADIGSGDLAFLERISPLIRSTFRSEVIKGVGPLGGMFSIAADRYRDKVLVSAVNGVGAKARVAQLAGACRTIGVDLVALCVNDVVARGAEPLFLLDYIATGTLSQETALAIVEGLVAACKDAHCTLLGGKTARIPGVFRDDGFDLAGIAVGAVDQDRLIDGASIGIGHQVIGIASSGLHAAGYDIIYRVLAESPAVSLTAPMGELGGESLESVLLRPTRIYGKTIRNLVRDFRIAGLAHVREGGIGYRLGNQLPRECQALIRAETWECPAVFDVVRTMANLSRDQMFSTFNMGLGMLAVVARRDTGGVLERLESLGERAWVVGEIVRRGTGDPPVRIE